MLTGNNDKIISYVCKKINSESNILFVNEIQDIPIKSLLDKKLAVTRISLTLYYNRENFYYQSCIHFKFYFVCFPVE